MANTVLIKMQCTRLTPAAAGAVMCALWRIRKGGKSANRDPSEFLSNLRN